MVSTSPTRHSHTKLTPEIAHEPKIIWVCPNPWRIQLKCHSSDPSQYKNNFHEKPTVRVIWAAHGVKVWYLGPYMEHYRCHCVYINKTIGGRDSYCVEFFTHNTPLPYNYSSESVIIAAHELAHALQNPAPQSPLSNIGDSQMVAIEQISGIFSKVSANLNQPLEPPQKQPVTK